MNRPGGLPFVRSALYVEEVDSTSDLARRLVLGGPLATPSAIWADRQTRGRGQRSNAWWSDAGSLTATVVIDPAAARLTIAHEPRVALATATAVIEAIVARYPGCRPGIRWPNDVEVDGRKLGGILPERVESAGGPRLLIGIGLNVRTRLEDAPPDVRRLAASLAEWEERPGPSDPRVGLLGAILGELEIALRALAAGDPGLPRRWDRLDTLAGTFVRVEVGAERIEGVAEGIDESGGLRVRTLAGPRVLHAGRVLRDDSMGTRPGEA